MCASLSEFTHTPEISFAIHEDDEKQTEIKKKNKLRIILKHFKNKKIQLAILNSPFTKQIGNQKSQNWKFLHSITFEISIPSL